MPRGTHEKVQGRPEQLELVGEEFVGDRRVGSATISMGGEVPSEGQACAAAVRRVST